MIEIHCGRAPKIEVADNCKLPGMAAMQQSDMERLGR